MPEIEIPFPFGDLPIKPELTKKVRISTDMTQTLAMLFGWDGQSRRMVRTSLSGSLHAVAPQVKGIKHYVASGAASRQTLEDMPTTEVLIQGLATNTGYVCFAIGEAVGADNYYKLDAEDTFTFAIDNTNRIQLLFEKDGESLVVVYSK